MLTNSPLDTGALGGGVQQEVEFVGFGPRLGAALLDALIFSLPLGTAAWYFTQYNASLVGFAIITILGYLYKPLLEHLVMGTPGKKILKLRVVQQGDKSITAAQAFMRSIPWLIPTLANAYFSYQMLAIPGYLEADGYMDRMQLMAEYMENNQGNFLTQSVLQGVVGFLPLVSALVMLGNPRKQAAHDILAETYVVRDPKPKF